MTALKPDSVFADFQAPPTSTDSSEFSIVQGGALYQLLLRTRLEKPSLELLARRTLVITSIVWIPLLVLSIISGRAWGNAKIPFLFDLAAQVRFLICLPLLLFAETVVHQRLRPIVGQFLARNLVPPDQEERFQSIVTSSRRMRDSVLVEIVLLVLVFGFGQHLWRSNLTLQTSTWYANSQGGVLHLTLPGAYFAFVSAPIFQFIILRWYYRLLIWYQALFRISRLNLRLIPTHADRMGGLGFLEGCDFALMPLLLAHSFLLSGVIANRIFHDGAKLPVFKMEIVIMVVILLMVVLVPLMVFAPLLTKCRRIGMLEYGRLASRYVNEFDQKWIRGKASADEALVGSADIQSLADMSGSYDIIREMQPFPFGKQTVLNLAVVTLLPIAPLVLTMIPFEELLNRIFKMLL